MLEKIALALFLLMSLLHAGFEYTINNTNFTIAQGSQLPSENENYLYNYDRLRFRGDYTDGPLFATCILDGVNYLGDDYVNSNSFSYIKELQADAPFKTQTSFHDYGEGAVYAKLYRIYGGYEDTDNRLLVGLQKISMGVGRIWTPTDLFNPKNTYALEPDEIFGVAAVSYTRYLNETSHISAVISQKSDHSLKYAARYKAYLDVTDFAINLIYSDETKMLGYEIEGDLSTTGIELRSEGAYIKNTLQTIDGSEKREFFQGILGADYGFENGVSIVTEALYSSENFSFEEILLNLDSEILSNLVYSKFYAALTLSYSFNIYLDTSLLYIESFNDENSRFISPTLTYTLNDYNSFIIGAMLQDGANGSEFGALENLYYFKYALSF